MRTFWVKNRDHLTVQEKHRKSGGRSCTFLELEERNHGASTEICFFAESLNRGDLYGKEDQSLKWHISLNSFYLFFSFFHVF